MLKIIIPLIIAIAVLLVFQPEFAVVTETSEQKDVKTEHNRVLNTEAPAEQINAESQSYQHPGSDSEGTINLNPEAIESLRQARLHGDDRTPNLNESRERDELPTPEQLEDPELYQEYERRQQQRMYRAYVEAAKVKTAELRKMIEQGKEGGISDEEIAFAEAKIQGIEDMAAQLQQDHPEIMQDEYKPADDWLINNLGVSDPESTDQEQQGDN